MIAAIVLSTDLAKFTVAVAAVVVAVLLIVRIADWADQ